MSTQIIECPICMDNINIHKNCITTECGHCFHASCIMRNVYQNGFACPLCRTLMAEEEDPEEEDVMYDQYYSSMYDDEYIIDQNPNDNILGDDYILRGLRLFTDNVEGIEHDQYDVLDEEYDVFEQEHDVIQEEHDILQEEVEDIEESKPSAAYVTQQLTLNGITMEHLVKILLYQHEEYYNENSYNEFQELVWDDIRNIITNYEESVHHQQPQEDEATLPDPATPNPTTPTTPSPTTPTTQNPTTPNPTTPVETQEYYHHHQLSNFVTMRRRRKYHPRTIIA